MAPHCVYKSIINCGSMAARICCSDVLTKVIAFGATPGDTSAFCDFNDDKNSDNCVIDDKLKPPSSVMRQSGPPFGLICLRLRCRHRHQIPYVLARIPFLPDWAAILFLPPIGQL